MFSYASWTYIIGIDEVIRSNAISSLKFRLFVIAYILPGVAYSLVIFPSTSSEALGTYQLFSRFGEHKPLTQIVGILILLFSYIMVFYVFTDI